MAQKLKDELRQAIIEAAKEEFLQKGYENASMRSIAAKADITVGNIYRYFENKEDLNIHILAETSQDMTKILDSLQINRLSKQPRVFNMKTDPSALSEMMDELSYKLVDLYLNQRSEFNIIMNDEQMNNKIKNWFAETFSSLIDQPYMAIDLSRERDILSDAYACAAFSGLRDIFMQDEDDGKVLYRIIRTYLRRFVSMVSEEIRNGNDY